MAHRLLATASELGRSEAASLFVSSSLHSWGVAADAADAGLAVGTASAANAAAVRARSALPPGLPRPQDSIELRRDLSVSVVPLFLHHATTYRRTPAPHYTTLVRFYNAILPTFHSKFAFGCFTVTYKSLLWSS